MSAQGSQRLESSRSIDAYDKRTSLWLHNSIGKLFPRQLYMLLEHSGNGILWLVLAVLSWSFGSRDPVNRAIWLNFFLGLWIDIALVGTLKMAAKRARPEYNISSDFILVVSVDNYSFPSGHAAR